MYLFRKVRTTYNLEWGEYYICAVSCWDILVVDILGGHIQEAAQYVVTMSIEIITIDFYYS